jgi:hypothetical protein
MILVELSLLIFICNLDCGFHILAEASIPEDLLFTFYDLLQTHVALIFIRLLELFRLLSLSGVGVLGLSVLGVLVGR